MLDFFVSLTNLRRTVSYPDGVNYLNTYLKAVYAKMQKRNPNLWVMINDAFMGAKYWAPFWSKGQNVAFDSVSGTARYSCVRAS